MRPVFEQGLGLRWAADGAEPDLSFELGSDGDPEAYKLDIGPGGVLARSSSLVGLRNAWQTLRQLMEPDALRQAPIGATPALPFVQIEDGPRFAWRGLHLDVSRHFMPRVHVLRLLDAMALHKLNVFHWHLTDDQGWRLEIRRFPRLTEVGGWRADTTLTTNPHTTSGKPHGGFYTQDDVREVVAYAAERGITVVPEIEMPGHSRAAIAAYPELGNTGAHLDVWTQWGVTEDVYSPAEGTFRFLEHVMEEVLELFPSTFIHVGGDECPKTQWKNSPEAQARMRALGCKDEDELQSAFIRHFDRWLAERGRRLVGWDEILEGGLAPGATVMSWRGTQGGIDAAKAGHDVVMTPGTHTYFDHYQSEDRDREPQAIGGFTSLEKAYSYEPIPEELNEAEAQHVLGAQGQLWTEFMRDPVHVEYMAFPRACALAEVLWSPREGRNWEDFRARMTTHVDRLRALGVHYRPLD